MYVMHCSPLLSPFFFLSSLRNAVVIARFHCLVHSLKLVDAIVPFFMKHNAETDACDLVIEVKFFVFFCHCCRCLPLLRWCSAPQVDRVDTLVQYVTDDNQSRVCSYLVACSEYTSDIDDKKKLLNTAFESLLQVGLNVATALARGFPVRNIRNLICVCSYGMFAFPLFSCVGEASSRRSPDRLQTCRLGIGHPSFSSVRRSVCDF